MRYAFTLANMLLHNTYSFQDMFHGHLIASATGLSILIHAFEYPSMNTIRTNLGFCQRNSNISAKTATYRQRNILVSLTPNTTQILPCHNVLCTRYAEKFGVEIGQLFYMPPILNMVHIEVTICR